MRAIVLLLIVVLVKPALAGEDWTKKITPEITLKAIQLYRHDPTTEDAMSALSIVTNFAEQSDQVTVLLQEKYFPFKLGSIASESESRFIGAFVAGNIERQLLNKINQNSPLEGIFLVLHTYKKLHEKGLFPKMENFEKWLLWQEKGDLEKNLKNITNHSSGSPTAPAELNR
jgi:hypothetical protein